LPGPRHVNCVRTRARAARAATDPGPLAYPPAERESQMTSSSLLSWTSSDSARRPRNRCCIPPRKRNCNPSLAHPKNLSSLRARGADTSPRGQLQEPTPPGASRISAFQQTRRPLAQIELGRAELTIAPPWARSVSPTRELRPPVSVTLGCDGSARADSSARAPPLATLRSCGSGYPRSSARLRLRPGARASSMPDAAPALPRKDASRGRAPRDVCFSSGHGAHGLMR
jgi:hypothetical protein